MHLGFGIPGIQHHLDDENGTSMNQTHNNNSIVDQVIHNLPTHLFMDHHNNSHHHQFLPISHYMVAEGAGASSAYYPVNFRLGLNEINSSSNTNERDCDNSINGDGAAGLLIRGSEHYQVPEEARHACLEMHQHCWYNPQDSTSIKQQQQPPFWEPLPAEVSNENSEIIDRLENIKMNQKRPLQSCSNSKTRLVYGEGELEAIYKRCRTSITINQTPDRVLPRGQDQGSDEASIEASVCLKDDRQDNKKKKKKKKKKGSCNELVQFFQKLVKQVVDHQENLHTKFAERMERLDGERREKEEAWRSRELVYFEQQAAARARENTLAATREDAIVSYLEKITGQNIPILDYWRQV